MELFYWAASSERRMRAEPEAALFGVGNGVSVPRKSVWERKGVRTWVFFLLDLRFAHHIMVLATSSQEAAYMFAELAELVVALAHWFDFERK